MKRNYTIAHRILHWLIAFTFLFILLTVFLRQQWMNRNTVAEIVSTRLAASGVTISPQAAVSIGKAVRAPMWHWHLYAGYTLLGLYILRLVVMRIQGPVFSNPFAKHISRKERYKGLIYLIFYICLGISLLTGAFIALMPYKTEWRPAFRVMKIIHVQSLYYSIAFIVLHLGGLVLAELGSDKGIISRMIHGGITKK